VKDVRQGPHIVTIVRIKSLELTNGSGETLLALHFSFLI
jgi:hypothetical protein